MITVRTAPTPSLALLETRIWAEEQVRWWMRLVSKSAGKTATGYVADLEFQA